MNPIIACWVGFCLLCGLALLVLMFVQGHNALAEGRNPMRLFDSLILALVRAAQRREHYRQLRRDLAIALRQFEYTKRDEKLHGHFRHEDYAHVLRFVRERARQYFPNEMADDIEAAWEKLPNLQKRAFVESIVPDWADLSRDLCDI